MTRMERNINRKKRRRALAFSLVVVFSFFLSGILVTNEVMIRMTNMPVEKNILSYQYLKNNLLDAYRNIPLEDWFTQIISGLRYLINRAQYLINRI